MTNTSRPPFRLSDLPATVMFAALGCLLGFGLALVVLLISYGFWMLLLILIPLFILQMIGHGILHLIIWAIACLWAMLRGKPLPKRPPSMPAKPIGPPAPQPWIKENMLFITMGLSFALLILSVWANTASHEGFL